MRSHISVAECSVVVTQVGIRSYEILVDYDFGDDEVLKAYALAKAMAQWQEKHPDRRIQSEDMVDSPGNKGRLIFTVD
ncbi:MAG TPA: hypothetical protein VHA78_05450 [Candidatus Peribacteraceae bacterium]|nr:hypothetical protein [Candidatus Peribacteraceae bacterium]